MIRQYLPSKAFWLIPIAVMMAIVFAACSSAPEPDAPAAPAPAAPAPAAPAPAAPAPAAPAPAAPAPAAPAPAPAPSGGPTGELTVAVGNVGTPAFTGATQAFPINRYHWAWGVAETLATLEPVTNKIIPMIATDWSFDVEGPGAAKLTINIRDDVPFHDTDQWGFVTADDVAFSMNDAGADNNQSAHDDGGEFADMWDRWTAIDNDTIEAPVDKWRFNSVEFSMVQGQSGFAIFSKKIYDELGAEAAVTTTIGTGPFKVNRWSADEAVDLEAVTNHWRQTPGFQNVRVLEVPENSTRVAMIETGQAQIGAIPLKDISRLKEAGIIDFKDIGVEVTSAVNFAGNYWQKETPDGKTEDTHGPLFPRPGFHPDADHPWIGDPDDPEQFERARKFRWALSMAIDREGINNAVLEGLGTVWYTPWVPPEDPNFDPKWVIPFDRDKAKEYLVEAGYPDCLSFTFFIPPDSGRPKEVGEAVAQMWRNLGCDVKIESTSYSVRRPTEVNREIDIPWLFGCGGRPTSLDQTLDPTRFSQPGWNHGIEASFYNDLFLKQSKEPDVNKRIENAIALNEFDWFNMPCTVVVGSPLLLAFNPEEVAGWTPHFEGVTEAAINNLESARPAN